jgi:pimeloyl-ACP methyl ester carboxylesterase
VGLQSRYFGYHGFNVLAVDLPAHGRSDGPALASVGEMADWVQNCSTKEHQVGRRSSAIRWARSIALEFAARYPERARRIALIGRPTR